MSRRFTARVLVTIKKEVADPQGQAVVEAVNHWLADEGGTARLAKARVGRSIDFEVLAENPVEAHAMLTRIADRVLANPNIEEFTVEIDT